MPDSNADLIGFTIRIDGTPFTVIGPAKWPESQYLLLQGPLDQKIRHASLVRQAKLRETSDSSGALPGA